MARSGLLRFSTAIIRLTTPGPSRKEGMDRAGRQILVQNHIYKNNLKL